MLLSVLTANLVEDFQTVLLDELYDSALARVSSTQLVRLGRKGLLVAAARDLMMAVTVKNGLEGHQVS